MKKNKAVFLDSDGVLNYVIFRGISPKPIAPWSLEEFNIIPGLKKPLSKLKEDGFYLFVITNQPDISKKIIDYNLVNEMSEILKNEFLIDEIVVCPHIDDDNCECRKPKPGMILELSKKYDIDLKSSYLVGDNFKDILAGKACGLKTVLIERFYNINCNADFKINNFSELLKIINKK